MCAGPITSLDFDPLGRAISTIDYNGNIVVSEVDTDRLMFHYKTDQKSSCKQPTLFYVTTYFHNVNLGYYSRCRWNPIEGNNLIAIKYNYQLLNLLDAEKQIPTLKISLELESGKSMLFR